MEKIKAEEGARMCLKSPPCGEQCPEFTDLEHSCILDEGHETGGLHECVCGFKFQEAPVAPAYIGRAC